MCLCQDFNNIPNEKSLKSILCPPFNEGVLLSSDVTNAIEAFTQTILGATIVVLKQTASLSLVVANKPRLKLPAFPERTMLGKIGIA